MIGGYLGQRPTLAWLWHALPRGVCPPREILIMNTPRDAFSLILGTKSRAFRTDFHQVMIKKIMMNWSVDCCYCVIFS